MAVNGINLHTVRDRLRELNRFATVKDVASAAEAMETAAKPPSAFVAVSSERPQANKTTGVHDQRVMSQIAVLVCDAAQRASDDLQDPVEANRLAVIGHLTAWKPTGADKVLDYAGYNVIRMGNGLIWYEISFTTHWTLRI